MRRPSYRAAIFWIAENDDTDCVNARPLYPSVSMSLIADLFGVDDTRVISDVKRYLDRKKEIKPC